MSLMVASFFLTKNFSVAELVEAPSYAFERSRTVDSSVSHTAVIGICSNSRFKTLNIYQIIFMMFCQWAFTPF